MSKIDVTALQRGFDKDHDAMTFEVDGVHFFACQSEELLKQVINDGYEKAAVVDIKPVERKGADDE